MDFHPSLSVGYLMKLYPSCEQIMTYDDNDKRNICIHITRNINRLENWIMPRKARKNSGNFSDWTMINCSLDSKQLKEFDSWLKDNIADVDEILGNVMLGGYKLSVSFDERSGSFISTLTGKDLDYCENAKCSMSSFDRTFASAVMMSLYKHIVVFDGGVWADTETTPRRG